MENKYGTSWKLAHSLHLLAIFCPILGFIGFFRRKACSGQKRWMIVAWIYVALDVVTFIVSNNNDTSFGKGFMQFYAAFYFATIVYACVTLPAYLHAVIARLEGGQTQQTPADVPAPDKPDASANETIAFDLSREGQKSAPELSADQTMRKIHQLGDILRDQPIYSQLCGIETICAQILDYVAKNPDEKDSAHTFTSYYLPEYSKLLGNYIELYQTPVKTDKMMKAMGQIQDSLPTTLVSFKNLYNGLFSEKADDISNSIGVLEKMMSQDGLSEDTETGDSIHLKL